MYSLKNSSMVSRSGFTTSFDEYGQHERDSRQVLTGNFLTTTVKLLSSLFQEWYHSAYHSGIVKS